MNRYSKVQLEVALDNLIRVYGFEHEVVLRFAKYIQEYLNNKKGAGLSLAIVYGQNMNETLAIAVGAI